MDKRSLRLLLELEILHPVVSEAVPNFNSAWSHMPNKRAILVIPYIEFLSFYALLSYSIKRSITGWKKTETLYEAINIWIKQFTS